MIAMIARAGDLAAEALRDGLRAVGGRLELALEAGPQLVALCGGERLRPDLEALVLAVRGGPPADDLRVGEARVDVLRIATHLLDGLRLRRGEVHLGPALEVDAEVEPAHPDRGDRDHDDDARDGKPRLAPSDEVDLQPLRALLAGRAHEARTVEPAEPGQQPEHRPRREDRRHERHRRTDQQHQREALDARRGDEEQDERRDRRHDVRVDDRVEPLRIAGGDRGPYGFARTDLFFDAFEDDHVRVGRDSDREDEAREAGRASS